MNYKKKYNKLVEAIKLLQETNPSDEGIQNWVNDNVPELAESQDEKVRKWVYNYFRACFPTWIHPDITCGEILAWLEKLKVFTEHGDGLYYFANSEFTYVGNPTCDNVSFPEKQDNKVIKCPQNHQSSSIPDGHIVLEDFNGGEGFYKVHLDYLNKKQVEEVEEMDRTWNKESNTSNEIIKNCIGMCLTDANEQRFKDYGTNLKECLDWLEKQIDNDSSKMPIWKHWKDGIAGGSEGEQIFLIKNGLHYSISSCLGYECDYIELSELDKLLLQEKQGQKSTWSEEDDSMFQSCIGAVATNDYYKGEEKEQIYDWLKSLKQRIGG